MMRIFVFLLFLMGFYISESNADDILLPERQATPGGVVVVELAGSSESRPEARFKKKKVMVIEKDRKWLAVVGIPLSTKSGKHSVQYRYPERNDWLSKEIVVDEKAYPEQRLTISNKRKVDPNEEDMKKIRADSVIIGKAKRHWSDEVIATRFKLPVAGTLSSRFGLKRFFNGKPRRPHGGLDIAAPEGTPVYAPAEGIVVETGDFYFSGKCIFIDHGQGLLTFYAHLSKIDVKPGQKLSRGQKIAEVGQTGRVTGPHLHWSVGLNQTWVEPVLFIDE